VQIIIELVVVGEPPLPDEAYPGMAETKESINEIQRRRIERSLCFMDFLQSNLLLK
jgi:hypothetical protein